MTGKNLLEKTLRKQWLIFSGKEAEEEEEGPFEIQEAGDQEEDVLLWCCQAGKLAACAQQLKEHGRK
jgi:hypothetical protein